MTKTNIQKSKIEANALARNRLFSMSGLISFGNGKGKKNYWLISME